MNTEQEIQQIKRNSFRFLLTMFLVFLLLILAFVIYWGAIKRIPILDEVSPNGTNEVEIVQLGNGFPYISPSIKVYFKENDRVKKTKKINVSNFMESNHQNRYNVSWTGENKTSIMMKFEFETKDMNFNFSTKKLNLEVTKTSNRIS
jgi:hypothetical protein